MSATVRPLTLDPADQAYITDQLQRVSRSFALLIPVLEPPLRHYLGIAYLLCRVADNIEDCTVDAAPTAQSLSGEDAPSGSARLSGEDAPSGSARLCGEDAPSGSARPVPSWKQARFAEFTHLLHHPEDAPDQLAAWDAWTWPGLTPDERALMGLAGGWSLWQIYRRFPDTPRQRIAHWVGVMAAGMSRLGEAGQRPAFVRHPGVDVLAEEEDYNAYCFYVAGTVGHLSSELAALQYGLAGNAAAALTANAEACGRSLQKTNILKDFAKDRGRGFCYVPDAWLRAAGYAPLALRGADTAFCAQVIGDVLHELRGGIEYVLSLPHRAVGYRRASLLCLFPAYQTLQLAAQRRAVLFTAEHQVKISRPTMLRCMLDSLTHLTDDDGIRRYGRKVEQEILRQLEA